MEPEVQLAKKEEGNYKSPNSSGIIWLFIILVLVLMALSVVFLGKSVDSNASLPDSSNLTPTPTETTVQPRIYTVSYKNGVFSPTNLRIHSGDTVRFRNESLFPIRVVSDPHPEHNNLVGFDSVGDIPQESYFSFTFAAKGIFGYHNEKNINDTGTIIVK